MDGAAEESGKDDDVSTGATFSHSSILRFKDSSATLTSFRRRKKRRDRKKVLIFAKVVSKEETSLTRKQ